MPLPSTRLARTPPASRSMAKPPQANRPASSSTEDKKQTAARLPDNSPKQSSAGKKHRAASGRQPPSSSEDENQSPARTRSHATLVGAPRSLPPPVTTNAVAAFASCRWTLSPETETITSRQPSGLQPQRV